MGFTLVGCTNAAPGRAPIARIVLSPTFVPQHDGYRTLVSADGSMSADPLDDPTAAQPLLFAWRVDDPEAAIVPDATASQITFRVAGDRVTAIELEVTDGDGRRTTQKTLLGVTIDGS